MLRERIRVWQRRTWSIEEIFIAIRELRSVKHHGSYGETVEQSERLVGRFGAVVPIGVVVGIDCR